MKWEEQRNLKPSQFKHYSNLDHNSGFFQLDIGNKMLRNDEAGEWCLVVLLDM